MTLEETAGPTSSALSEHELDGELAIYDSESHQAYFLNATASAVWRALTGSAPQSDVIESVAEAFGLEAAVISSDVSSLLDELDGLGLLESRHPPRRKP